jgi:hypothetical protein
MIMKQFSILILLLLLATTCSHDPLPTYSDADRIFFKWAAITSLAEKAESGSDFIKVNLGYDNPVKDDSTVLIDVSMMGHVSAQDRPISAELMDSSSAIAGQDIEILPSFIPAGKAEGKLAVKLKNSAKLADTTLWARIKLVSNSHFQVDYTQAYTLTGLAKDKTGLEYNIYFDAKVDMPSLWADLNAGIMLTAYFGTYSNRKLQVICDVCGLSWAYFMHEPGENAMSVLSVRFPTNIVMGMISQVNRYLKQYQQEHGEPLRDENGNIISLPVSIDR